MSESRPAPDKTWIEMMESIRRGRFATSGPIPESLTLRLDNSDGAPRGREG